MNEPGSFNPYEAPATPTSALLSSGPRPIGAALPWTPTEAISFGWNLMVKNPMCILIYFVGMLIANLISGIGNGINFALSTSGDEDLATLGLVIYVFAALLSLPVSIWIQMGLLRYAIAVVRRQPDAGFGEVFKGGPFGSFFGGSLLVGLGVVAGSLLCIVPGIILALGWLFFSYFVIDRRMGAIEAIKASWQITSGHKGSLFVLMLLAILLGIAGYLACCVGIFAALPVIQFAMVYVYAKLTGEEPLPVE